MAPPAERKVQDAPKYVSQQVQHNKSTRNCYKSRPKQNTTISELQAFLSRIDHTVHAIVNPVNDACK